MQNCAELKIVFFTSLTRENVKNVTWINIYTRFTVIPIRRTLGTIYPYTSTFHR